MGRQLAGWGIWARAAILAAGALTIANCAGPAPSTRTTSSYLPPRVVEEGEPIPKGGGSFRVGKPYTVNGRTYTPVEDPTYRAEGVASWYGPDFHGRLTANREVYDMNGLSAAHPTMPLPSYARVTNLRNGRSIIVRVNNRGPFAHDRLIDVSVGTAKALDFYGKGLAQVRVEFVGRAPIEGNDDGMLLATLRTNGAPAPAPSKVMVATAAKPFVSDGDGKRSPSDRPIVIGNSAVGSSRTATPEPPRDSQVVGAIGRAPGLPSLLSARGDAPTLGLMSGRGLY